MARIFISYSRADLDTVKRIETVIRILGHNPTLDIVSFRAGVHLSEQITREIERSDFFCPVLSPNALLSNWVVHEEIPYAIKRRVRILPILIQQCEMPPELNNLRYVDFSTEFETGVTELCKSLPRAPYDEIEFLRSKFSSRRLGRDGPFLLDVLRGAIQKNHQWTEGSARELMNKIQSLPSADRKVNDIYWWLMNYGVLAFKGITAEEMCFANEDWRASVSCALLTERGRAFLDELAAEKRTWLAMKSERERAS